jgi:hypothetical protein
MEPLNELVWWVGNSPVPDGSTVSINQARTITVNGTDSVPLVGQIIYHDYVNDMQLQINTGNTVTFYLGGGLILDVTPIAYDKYALPGVNYYMPSDYVNADFTLRVPDGGVTAMLLGIGMLAIGWFRRIVK